MYNFFKKSVITGTSNDFKFGIFPSITNDFKFGLLPGTSNDFKYGLLPESWPKENWENGEQILLTSVQTLYFLFIQE